jgi:Cft2 family RNA processing exonuclease
MRITNLNPDSSIGASSWFVEFEGHRLLLDAGTHPRYDGRASLPLYDLVAGQEMDAIALTHCHLDHVGSLPVAINHFPKAHVLMTELSYFIVERVLHNSVNVMMREREERGVNEYPLYTHREVEDIAPLFQGFRYNREIEWAAFHKTKGGGRSPTLEFLDAGHTLGSAGVMVRGKRETLFYSGDVCFHDQTILRAARFEDVQADVLVLECTRGNRAVPKGFTRVKETERLAESIQRVLKRKGNVLIPAFALGRTQEILTLLALLMREGKLKRQPIYIGGLGRVFTEIYDLQAHRTHRQHSNLALHETLELIVASPEQINKMKLSGGGRIFVITSGMMNENTAAHDLAARMMGDPKQAIFFVGYADPETPGGRLKAAKPGQKFIFSAGAGELVSKCEIGDFDLTAHANRSDLLDFVSQVEPRVVLLTHGDDASRKWMEQQIRARHPKMKVIQPQPGKAVDV